MKTTETKDSFYNNMIVEFAYDKDDEGLEGPWKWKPLRVRYDKITKLVNGERMYGNHFDTANSNWRSIHHPVTEAIIMGDEMPSVKTSQEVVYYNLRDKQTKTKRCNSLFERLRPMSLLLLLSLQPRGAATANNKTG